MVLLIVHEEHVVFVLFLDFDSLHILVFLFLLLVVLLVQGRLQVVLVSLPIVVLLLLLLRVMLLIGLLHRGSGSLVHGLALLGGIRGLRGLLLARGGCARRHSGSTLGISVLNLEVGCNAHDLSVLFKGGLLAGVMILLLLMILNFLRFLFLIVRLLSTVGLLSGPHLLEVLLLVICYS
jgi:hypothetical protein